MSRPNPFVPGSTSTRIDFDLAKPGQTVVRILDVSGREVRVLANAEFKAGPHDVFWDGRDQSGHPAAAGTYVYQLVSGAF